ncbi:hypothetical protein BCT46_15115 [Vibrio sp. 10N.261.46.E8]|nr:hypothetical protein BH584_04935 [Vibrio sp. 10N.261.45.E1]PMJ34525.1 hypothetical protein BCU27_03600 [Vibrio sp. 10N.286.45.B6]PML88053.1 hypothetical protein BCT66_10670 [Vibrio sp. 10N.261.49.E11]PMM67381.1 hypothetical protein BCT48_15140 [Vibrio sp. 10N.261.46.F12]PMM81736.1 hypothetical protein BCT46_15115 [Vibrio sp. 10N.261.46.E8]PMN77896.1 hypothetical protein BCT22_20210 [Vibrio sp. 10N.261.45.A1]PMN91964.1 hypothetical protein BCT25_01065 [Vibrio sp. 10N.261.45.A6]
MRSQGVLSVVQNGEVILKAIAGSSGFNIDKLKERIPHINVKSPLQVYQAAIEVGFGTKDNLVVMATPCEQTVYGHETIQTELYDYEVLKQYWKTFQKPEWNPREVKGFAEHTTVVEVKV